MAQRAPPGKSLTSKAICSSAPPRSSRSSSASCSAGSPLPGRLVTHRLLRPWGGCATRLVDLPRVAGLVRAPPSVSSTSSVLVVLVELVVDGDVALVGAGPADCQLAERLGLLEGDRGLPEQLEQGEEARHDDERAVGVGDEARGTRPVPRWRSRSTMIAACSRTLTWGACRCSRPTVGATLGVIARAAIMANCSGVMPMTSSGSSAANSRLEAGLARRDAPGRGHPLARRWRRCP